MADLATTAELKTFMGVSGSTDDTLIGTLLDSVEEMLERACGRSDRPFQAAESNRTDVLDGTGRATIFVGYPIDFVSSITLGYDVDNPDEELDPDDPLVVVWAEGGTKIERVDGGYFGSPCYARPRYVTVEYKTQADLPDLAKLAVQRAVATLYRQRGSEDVIGRNESLSDYSHTLSTIEEDSIWKLAVKQLGEVRIA